MLYVVLYSVRKVLSNPEKRNTGWEIDVFECNLKYMGANDAYHKTLKECHVI